MRRVVILLALLLLPLMSQAQTVSGDRFKLNTGPCVLRSGSGSPEGVVTGNVCDTYWNTANGDLWRKATGTGNTGWVIVPALSGTIGKIAKWTGSSTLGDSILTESGGDVLSSGGLGAAGNLKVRNKSGSGWMDLAARDESGAEAKYSLQNLSVVTADQFIGYVQNDNVFDAGYYGAVCNGVTDDSAAIQAAIDAAEANGANGGGIVQLRSGTCNLGATGLTISPSYSVVLRGAGRSISSLLYSGTGAAIDIGTVSEATYNARVEDVSILVSHASATGIRMRRCWYCAVDRVYLENSSTQANQTGWGVSVGGDSAFSTGLLFRDMRINLFKFGLTFALGTGDYTVTGSRLDNVVLTLGGAPVSGSVGIKWFGSNGNQITGGNIEWYDYGVYLTGPVGGAGAYYNRIDTRYENCDVRDWYTDQGATGNVFMGYSTGAPAKAGTDATPATAKTVVLRGDTSSLRSGYGMMQHRATASDALAVGADVGTWNGSKLNLMGDVTSGGTSGGVGVNFFAADPGTWRSAVSVMNVSGLASTGQLNLMNEGGAVVVGNATGGHKGDGTINAKGLYVNGVAVGGGSVDASTLTGTTLASGVTASSLTSVGTLTSLINGGLLTTKDNILFSTGTAYKLYGNSASDTSLAIQNDGAGVMNVSIDGTLSAASVAGAGASPALTLAAADGAFNGIVSRLNVTRASSTAFDFMRGYANNAQVFAIDGGGSFYERGRTTAMGEWVYPAEWNNTGSFDASKFTASGSMTWTVAAADVAHVRYSVVGKTMTLQWRIQTTTTGGTASSGLRIAIPGGYSAAYPPYYFAPGSFNYSASAWASGQVGIEATTYVVVLLGAGNWGIETDTIWTQGSITFEIQ